MFLVQAVPFSFTAETHRHPTLLVWWCERVHKTCSENDLECVKAAVTPRKWLEQRSRGVFSAKVCSSGGVKKTCLPCGNIAAGCRPNLPLLHRIKQCPDFVIYQRLRRLSPSWIFTHVLSSKASIKAETCQDVGVFTYSSTQSYFQVFQPLSSRGLLGRSSDYLTE